MKSIAFVIPYFGKLPDDGFRLWLLSCKTNPSIDFIIFTDDKREFDYPDNVKVNYCSFDSMINRIQSNYDFDVYIKRGWNLCDIKPAYGDIFKKELSNYDFWGHCDIDLMWGDIRAFYTDEKLEKYERVGNLGHCNIYKNTPEVCSRYKTDVPNMPSFKTAVSCDTGYAYDEVGMDAIYDYLQIPYYKETIFANLTKYETYFHLDLTPPEEEYKNNRQVLTWENGKAYRHYLYDGKVHTEEYMYIHFWCRPLSYKISEFTPKTKYLIYPDIVTDKKFEITPSLVEKFGKPRPIAFYAKSIWKNRQKLTLKRIIFNVKNSIKARLNK